MHIDFDSMDFLHFDVQRQQVPFMYYKRFQVTPGIAQQLPIVWTIPLDKGYGFLLRRLSGQAAKLQPEESKVPVVSIKLFDTKRGREWQNVAYPRRLVLTPGNIGVSSPQPSPVDLDGFGIGMTDEPVKNQLTYNKYYAYRQTVKVEMYINSVPELIRIMWIDLILDGYLIPELGLEQWQ